MGEDISKLAIPVFRSRVAPVLNWCSRMLIFSADLAVGGSGHEILLPDMSAFERLRMLQKQGVSTLICGALSPDLLQYADHLGLHVIYGVAGDIDDVLGAYRHQRLDQPRYWLPGCKGRRNYRQGCVRNGAESSREEDWDTPAPGTPRAGPGGSCRCPRCGTKVPHQQGIPCSQTRCPECNQPLLRE